jgi:hypothetical protein
MMDHKVILITGSSKGIGAEMAINFVTKGHRVIIHYHRSAKEADYVTGQNFFVNGGHFMYYGFLILKTAGSKNPKSSPMEPF